MHPEDDTTLETFPLRLTKSEKFGSKLGLVQDPSQDRSATYFRISFVLPRSSKKSKASLTRPEIKELILRVDQTQDYASNLETGDAQLVFTNSIR